MIEPPLGTMLMVFNYNMYYLIWREDKGWSISGELRYYTWDQLIYRFDERYLGIARTLIVKPNEIS